MIANGADTYADAALAGELDNLRGTSANRNDAANRAAFQIGTLVGAGRLNRVRTESELVAAAIEIGLPEREARSTIRSGLDAGQAQPRNDVNTNGHQRASSPSRPLADFGKMAAAFARSMSSKRLDALACDLGVTPDALQRLGVGVEGERSTWQEHGADGRIVGILRRSPDGSKLAVKGSRRGLILPDGGRLPDAPDGAPLLVAEGASDVAALLTLGLPAIGRAALKTGADMLAELLANHDGPVIVLADRDGEQGAEDVAAQLVAAGVPALVRWAPCPGGAKDVRAWLANQGLDLENDQACVDAGADFLAALAPRTPEFMTDDEPESPTGYRPVPVTELGEDEPPDWIWPGCIARGSISLLVGMWKGGKSTLVAHLLRDLERGAGLVDKQLDRPVLVVSEEQAHHWRRRRTSLGLGSLVHYVYSPGLRISTFAQWQALIEAIRQDIEGGPRYALVIFDTIGRLWSAFIESENDSAEVDRALQVLSQLAEAGAAVLLCHHPRKSEGAQEVAARGSGAILALPDILLDLRRMDGATKDDCRRVLSRMGRYEESEGQVVIELRQGGYHVLGSKADALLDEALAKVMELVPTTGAGATADEMRADWPEEKPPSKGTILRWLAHARDRGLVERSGTGNRNDAHRFVRTKGDEV